MDRNCWSENRFEQKRNISIEHAKAQATSASRRFNSQTAHLPEAPQLRDHAVQLPHVYPRPC